MDLFNNKLTFNETLQFDSLIDNGHYDPHLILIGSMMKNPEYVPSSEESQKILHHLKISDNKPAPTEPPTTEPTTEPEMDNTECKTESIKENKNKSKTYIKLPNASITIHKHKFKQLSTE